MSTRKSVAIEFGDKTYEVVADFRFIDRVEDRFTLIEFADSLDRSNPKVRNIAWFLWCAIRDQDPDVRVEDIGNRIIDSYNELAKASNACRLILGSIFTAGPEKGVKVKEGEEDDKKK